MAICRLCRQDRNLRESHYIPAAIYAELRTESERNPNPVLMNGEVSLITSWQLTEIALCDECENRFNENGERWVLANMSKGDGGFPIHDVLNAMRPQIAPGNVEQFAMVGIDGIDMDALVYFALSIFWRGSAITWHNRGRIYDGINLGPFEETIGTFLLGGAFPRDVVVLVTVWPRAVEVLPAAHTPRQIRIRNREFSAYNFYIPGLDFKLFVGNRIPDAFRRMCSYASPQRYLYADLQSMEMTLQAFAGLARGREAARLRQFREEQVRNARRG
jgi:hypothetical protein